MIVIFQMKCNIAMSIRHWNILKSSRSDCNVTDLQRIRLSDDAKTISIAS